MTNHEKISPDFEQAVKDRNEKFYSQNYLDVAAQLTGNIIKISNGQIVTVATTSAYDKENNSKRRQYVAPIIDGEVNPGDVLVTTMPVYKNSRLALVAALENGEHGACVGIDKVRYTNEKGNEVESKSKKEVCEALGISELGVYTLQFVDPDSNIMQIISHNTHEQENPASVGPNDPSPDEVNAANLVIDLF